MAGPIRLTPTFLDRVKAAVRLHEHPPGDEGGAAPEATRLPRSNAERGVLEATSALLQELPRGRLLDAPCGEGPVSLVARDLGFEVTPADIVPEQFIVDGLECARVDLNAPLPYADGSFDVVVCVEGIEHVENQYQLLREFRRILTDEGVLLVTTPNILSLPSRLRLLTTGVASYFDFDYWMHTGHIMPISSPQLYTALLSTGFSLEAVTSNGPHPRRWLMRPLAPLIRVLTRRGVQRRDLHALLTSDAALFDAVLLFTARARTESITPPWAWALER